MAAGSSIEHNVEHAIEYGMSLVGRPYGWWTGGAIPEGTLKIWRFRIHVRCLTHCSGVPMFALDGAAPPAVEVEACNCTGLTNLMLRAVGIRLPYHEVHILCGIGWRRRPFTR